MKHRKTFLGVGWKFPPEFDKESKTVTLISEEDDIKESLIILFSTRPGERMMQPEYGCDLSIINFEPISSSLLGQLENLIQFAILRFEPRIQIDSIEILTEKALDGILEISVDYIVRKTNSRSNIVFPYYIIEGTDVSDMPV